MLNTFVRIIVSSCTLLQCSATFFHSRHT